MILSHRIEIDPTFKQAKYFARAAGCSRFVWNLALEEWTRQYKAGLKPNGRALRAEFNTLKYEVFPWMAELHRDANSEPFRNLQVAFSRFFKGVSKYPTFKKKGRNESFYVANDRISVFPNAVRLPLVGLVRLTEPLRFTGKIIGATVGRTADRWYIAIQVDVGEYAKPRIADGIVGVDLGVKCAATLSTGEQLDSPKPLKEQLNKLAMAQREMCRRQKGSKNREKSKRKVAKIYARIARIRNDWLHKTTTKLCRENQAVGIEDLNVRGMVKNRCLSRAISDIGFGEFRRQLTYKSMIYGTRLVVADRWYPSSKTCNACGQVKKTLTLKDRVFLCDGCGHESDRDVNAARNLKDLCTAGFAGINACGDGSAGGSRGASRETAVCEAGTKPCL